ncbi:hypothetical protein PG985_014445 [Apiospora marii]|uniref:uncharacterized protein n=1 Tax=Apiospora marii TaxID=335849 RepID=UPI003130C1D4
MASPREIRQTRETRSRLIAQDGATRKLTIKSGGTKRVGAFRASIHKSPNGAAGMEGASICNYQHKMLEDFELHTRQKNPKDCQYHKIHEAGTNPVPSLHPDRGQPPRPDPALSCWPLAIISPFGCQPVDMVDMVGLKPEYHPSHDIPMVLRAGPMELEADPTDLFGPSLGASSSISRAIPRAIIPRAISSSSPPYYITTYHHPSLFTMVKFGFAGFAGITLENRALPASPSKTEPRRRYRRK